MLATLTQVLSKANRQKYAVGAFNTNNMEIVQAIVRAAEKVRSPVIVQTTEGAIEYAGLDTLKCLVLSAAEQSRVPVVLHLDHGKDLTLIRQCMNRGYTSVMIDGSHFPFDKNVKVTRKVVRWARAKGVSVEGELGTIGGAEDLVSSRRILYTEPKTAVDFVDKTGVDALAIAIGTSHGAYKFQGKATLDIKRLADIKRRLKMPLVLHGASGVPESVVAKAEKYGAKLGKPEGVPDTQIRLAVKNGINKINTDTDLRLAFDAALREVIATKPDVFDPRKILGPARDCMQQVVEHRIRVFGSANKA
ncbi:class II fructose-1,6-bisphosphate aldolase [Candidatus Woesearchaeota archaeon]|nr:class II fructose-1,6-bisphosphate aldolase [Candidatus Woesearchaeota archaeon]